MIKKLLFIITAILLFIQTSHLHAQNFYLLENGVTVMCPDAEIGETGTVFGVTYTKRTVDQITEENASTTCTSGITDMSNLFRDASSFSEDISSWDVSNVSNMIRLFHNADNFNANISNWDVSRVENMTGMFKNAYSFSQNLSDWFVPYIPQEPMNFSNNSSLLENNKPTWADWSDLSNDQIFLNIIQNKIESLTGFSQVETYENGNKHLLAFDFSVDLGIGGKVQFVLDMDDLMNITEEGQAGYVTYWVNAGFSVLSASIFPISGGASIFLWERTTNVDDPRFQPSFVPFIADLAIYQLSFLGFNEDGSIDPVNHGFQLSSNLAGISAANIGFNVIKGELSKDVLKSALLNNLIGSGVLGPSALSEIFSNLFFEIFEFDGLVSRIQNTYDHLAFTSFDSPAPDNITYVWSEEILDVSVGTEIDEWGNYRNKFVPSSQNSTNGQPDNLHPLKVGSFGHHSQEKNFYIEIDEVDGEGWFIEAENVDGEPDGDRFPVFDVAPNSSIVTFWLIGNEQGSSEFADLTFQLYQNRSFPASDILLDEFNVRVTNDPSNIGIGENPFFLLADNGVTIKCPDAEVGDTGEVNGVIYTKRMRNQITEENASTTCTSGIANMSGLFAGSSDSTDSFNNDISHWDVSNVTNMGNMFSWATSFNQDIGDWDVGNVTNMAGMFSWATSFNQDIGNWNVSNVYNMISMFKGENSFNQDIGNWDVGSVTRMERMFENAASFNQNLSNWCVTNITSEPNSFSTGSPLLNEYKPIWGTCGSTEIGWANLQWPGFGAAYSGNTFDVYTQVYIEGITGQNIENPNIQSWIGFSQENTHPSEWDSNSWITAEYNTSIGNNDEYSVSAENLLPGTYYYASRFKYANNDYVYGGISDTGGNFWDGNKYSSGILIIADVHQEIFFIDADNPVPVYSEMTYDTDTPVTVFGTYSFWEEQYGHGVDAFYMYEIPENRDFSGSEPVPTSQESGLIINDNFLPPFNPSFNENHIYVYEIPEALINEQNGSLKFVINDMHDGVPAYGDNTGELIAISNFSFGKEGHLAVNVKDAHSNPKENVELIVYPQNSTGQVFSKYTNQFGVAVFENLSLETQYVIEAYHDTPVINGLNEFWGSVINQSISASMPTGVTLERNMVYSNSVNTFDIYGEPNSVFYENELVDIIVELKNSSNFDQVVKVELHIAKDTLQAPIQISESQDFEVLADSSKEITFTYEADIQGELYIKPHKTTVLQGEDFILTDSWFWVLGFEVLEIENVSISNVIPQSPVTLNPGDVFEYEVLIRDQNDEPVEGITVDVSDDLNNQNSITTVSNSDGSAFWELEVPQIIDEETYEITFLLNDKEVIRTINIEHALNYDALIIAVDGIAGLYGVLCNEGGDIFETCRTRETNYLEDSINSLGLSENFHIEAHQWDGFTATSRDEIDNIKDLILDRYEYTSNNNAKLIVIGHSWGTFLTYVALGELSDSVEVDLYIMLSSPIGTIFRKGDIWFGLPDEDAKIIDLATKLGIIGKVNSVQNQIGVTIEDLEINANRIINWWVRGDLISGPVVELNSSYEDRYIHYFSWFRSLTWQTILPSGESYHDFTKLISGIHDSNFIREEVKSELMNTLNDISLDRPGPWLVNHEITADTVNVGDNIDVEIIATNLGGTTDYASITVSFPELQDPADINLFNVGENTSSPELVNFYPKGETIYDISGEQFEAEYLMVEFGDFGWESYTDRTLSLKYTGQVEDDFEIYYRINMQEPQTEAYFNYPTTSQVIDQQGWPVIDHTVYVADIPTQIDKHDTLPAEFTLRQNYPNPFNPVTVIEFGIPQTTDVSLHVYNLLGQRVATLVNEQKSTGWHNVRFDASNLSSGMYIYRIQAGEYVETKKLLLIK